MKPHEEDNAPLERLLVEHREELLLYVRRHAGGGLLRMETAEDLAQAICAHALAAARRGASEVALQRGWLFRVAQNFLNDRRDHWSALKRLGGGVMRSALVDSTSTELDAVRDLASSVTGPSTFAARRELLEVAAVALDMLLPRDREYVEGFCQGAPLAEQASAFGMSYAAAARGRTRAVERFRRCFELTLRSRGASS